MAGNGVELVGKNVKIVYRDGKHTKVIRGKVLGVDDFSITIKTADDGKVIMIGKSTMTSCKEVD